MTVVSSAVCAPATVRAIVTGHSRGLGAALAARLLQQRIAVLGLGRSTHPSGAALAAGSASSVQFEEALVDLADPAALEQWLATDALARFAAGAACVLLFNNAGTVEPIAPAGAQDPAAIGRAIALNVAAPLMLANAVASATTLDAATERRIVHVSSGAARHAYAGWSVYCATKAALDQHACAVALDAPPAVRICSIAPGVIDTGMQATIRATDAARFPSRERFEQLKQNGRLATPERAAQQLIDYALSDAFGSTPTADVRELAPA